MGGIGDFLFGSSEDAKQIGNAPTLTPGQTDLLDQLTTLLGGELGQPGPVFGGQTVAGPSSIQDQLFGATGDLFGQGGLFGTGEQALQTSLADFDPQATTDFFNTSIRDPALKGFQEDILPMIQESFIGQNAGRSGAANRAIAGAGADVQQGLDAQLAQLLFSGQESSLNRQQAGGQNLLNSIFGAGTMGGETQRGIETQGLQDIFRQFQEGQSFNNPALSFLNTAFGTKAFEPIVQGPTQQSGLVQDLAPAAMLAYALSSKKYKENIKPCGPRVKCIQPVTFDYTQKAILDYPEKTSPGRQFGFIAEDVVEVYPEAVIFKDGKPDAINYGKLSQILEV